jgi:alkylated DNA repair dioxygenase AlkB
MTQGGLFAPEPLVLVDDEHGRFAYEPGLVEPVLAQAWFDTLRGDIDWQAHYALGDAFLHPVLADAGRRVIAATGVHFTSVGLNLYRDGRDSVAPHNDHLDEIEPGSPIALLSLGATRRMALRERQGARRALDIDLEPGSLLTMSFATQHHWDHGIPKTRGDVGPRISLAFRVRTGGRAGGRRYASRPAG